MCGIAGILQDNADALAEQATAVTRALSHRGPDGEGVFLRSPVALGHRRLAIIAPATGAQPMVSPDKSLALTYNGEIYNFRELRRELESRGHTFHTGSDTEVVLHSYAEWGKDCLHHFRGMFAFAIADFRKRELFLARDRFGIKPLVYLQDNSRFAFASEIQALWEIADFSWEIDLASIDRYLHLQYIPAPRTAFRNVFKLPAGHWMVVHLDSRESTVRSWWRPEFRRSRLHSAAEWEERLDHALRESVKAHLVSDVPFGAFLSGGVDSSLMVGYMAEELGSPVKTFSIGFEGDPDSELPHARRVAEHYGTEHHEEIVRPDALAILPELVRHYGEPFGDQSAIPTWYLSRLASISVPMAVSGDGGDELFAGYGSYPAFLSILESRRPHHPVLWKDRLYPLASRLFPSRYPDALGTDLRASYWLECVQRFSDSQRARLWRPEYRFVADLPAEAHLNAFRATRNLPDLQQALAADIRTFLVDDILAKIDVASMAHGLEVRPPLLDPSVFDIARRMPEKQLMPPSDDLHGRGKHPLKALIARRFSPEFAWRQKQGFVMPLESWFRNGSGSFHQARDLALSPDSQIGQWFQAKEIQDTFKSGTSTECWLLLVLEHWLRTFRNRDTVSSARPVSPPASPVL